MSYCSAIKCDWCGRVDTFPTGITASKMRDVDLHKLGWRTQSRGRKNYDFCGGCLLPFDGNTDEMIDELESEKPTP